VLNPKRSKLWNCHTWNNKGKKVLKRSKAKKEGKSVVCEARGEKQVNTGAGLKEKGGTQNSNHRSNGRRLKGVKTVETHGAVLKKSKDGSNNGENGC